MVWLPKADINPDVPKYFRKKLLIVPRKLGNFGGDEDVTPTPIKCWSETPDEFGVPRAFWFATAKGEYEYDWDVSFGSPTNYGNDLKQDGPYAEQAEVLDILAAHFDFIGRHDALGDQEAGEALGGIFQADPGFGKTNVALALFHRLKTTAMVIVHKEFLLRQWKRRIEKWLPGAKVGIVQGTKCEFEGKDIVIAMVESLALEDGNRYPIELYDWPGILVLDEVHRIAAPSWNPVPERFPAAVRLGLSATPRRKDGADAVFWWHIGPIVHKAKTEMPAPFIRMIQVPKTISAPEVLSRPEANDAVVITTLAKLTARNWRITQEIVKALKSPSKRKVMVLSERLDHLRRLEKELDAAIQVDAELRSEGITTSFYVGEWFTGEVVPRLAPKEWPMEGDGRENAIKLIYASISRRKKYKGKIGKRVVMNNELGIPTGVEISKNGSKEAMEKTHAVFVDGYDLRGLDPDGEYVEGSRAAVVLEDLTDDELLSWAVWFSIRQKEEEKLRKQTEEELFEAERARVIFATYQMCAEGVDLPAVDTVVFASPVSDVEQSTGRGRRHCLPDPDDPDKCTHFCLWRAGKCKGKDRVVIADIADIGIPLCSKRSRWRKQWYWDNGFKVAEGS
jgi:superfamily II DNA or RNA helicase